MKVKSWENLFLEHQKIRQSENKVVKLFNTDTLTGVQL